MLFALHIRAYSVEVHIIGYDDISPLKETVESLQQCGETFFGFYSKGELCGAVSVKVDGSVADIHRLIVDPKHFKKGIAQQLLNFIEMEGVKKITVSTGSKNYPAINLYKKKGFQQIKEVRVNERLSLTFFEKKTAEISSIMD